MRAMLLLALLAGCATTPPTPTRPALSIVGHECERGRLTVLRFLITPGNQLGGGVVMIDRDMCEEA